MLRRVHWVELVIATTALMGYLSWEYFGSASVVAARDLGGRLEAALHDVALGILSWLRGPFFAFPGQVRVGPKKDGYQTRTAQRESNNFGSSIGACHTLPGKPTKGVEETAGWLRDGMGTVGLVL